MGKKLKHLWHRRPRLSRVGKIIRNLLIITLALLAWWWEDQCPPLTRQGAVAQLTRELMLPEPETVLFGDDSDTTDWVFVKGENYAYLAALMDDLMFPLGVTASLLDGTALDGTYTLLRQNGYYFPTNFPKTRIMVCPEGPKDAVSCTVDLEQRYWAEDDRPATVQYQMNAERETYGAYIFRWVFEDEQAWRRANQMWSVYGHSDLIGATYVLRFYDKDHQLVGEQEDAFLYNW